MASALSGSLPRARKGLWQWLLYLVDAGVDKNMMQTQPSLCAQQFASMCLNGMMHTIAAHPGEQGLTPMQARTHPPPWSLLVWTQRGASQPAASGYHPRPATLAGSPPGCPLARWSSAGIYRGLIRGFSTKLRIDLIGLTTLWAGVEKVCRGAVHDAVPGQAHASSSGHMSAAGPTYIHPGVRPLCSPLRPSLPASHAPPSHLLAAAAPLLKRRQVGWGGRCQGKYLGPRHQVVPD